LPDGFQRIRYYGFLGNRYRKQKLDQCRRLLGMPNGTEPTNTAEKDYQDRYEELTGVSLRQCPECKQGRMMMVQILPRRYKFDGDRVTFRYKDYAHGGKQRKMTLSAAEFLRRFFQHVLPKGFVRIRHFGFLSNRFRSRQLVLCQRLLATSPVASPIPQTAGEIPRTGIVRIAAHR